MNALSIMNRKNNENAIVAIGIDNKDYISISYSDFVNNKRVTEITNTNGILRICKKIHTAYTINKCLNLPYQGAWVKASCDVIKKKGISNPILYCMESPDSLNPEILRYYIKNLNPIVTVLNIINPVDSKLKERINRCEELYDYVITCNQSDAISNNWIYFPNRYSKPMRIKSEAPKSDVCFIGAEKGRGEFLWKLYRSLTEAGYKCDFMIVGKDRYRRDRPGFRYLAKSISYIEYLQHIESTTAILEVVVSDQNYCTLRTMEAIAYRKILITTNQKIKNENFYTKDQFYIIDKNTNLSELKLSGSGFTPLNVNPFRTEDLVSLLDKLASQTIG